MVIREEVPDGWAARGALNYKLLESDQHSEICSDPLIFFWFVINCTLYNVVHREGSPPPSLAPQFRGAQLITNQEKNSGSEEISLCWTHFSVRS